MSKGLINKVLDVAKKHSPELLVSAGVVGMVVSTVMAVKATPKAIELIEEKKGELGVTCLTKKETVQAAWKPYDDHRSEKDKHGRIAEISGVTNL